jgi:hypothetical protein
MEMFSLLGRIFKYDRMRLVIFYLINVFVGAVYLYMTHMADRTLAVNLFYAIGSGVDIVALLLLMGGMVRKKHEAARRWLLVALISMQSAFLVADAVFALIYRDFSVSTLLIFIVALLCMGVYIWHFWMLKNYLKMIQRETKKAEGSDCR